MAITKRFRSYIYLIAVAAIWGAAAPVIKFTFGGLDPLPFLAYRFLVAGVVSALIFIFKSAKGENFSGLKKHIGISTIYGFLAVPLALGILFFGLEKSTVLDLTLIGVIGPLIVTLGGAIFFHDRITKREKIGISIVLLGVVLNSLYPIFKNNGVRLTGNLILIAFLFADSSSVLLAKKAVQRKVSSMNLTNFAFIIGALVLIPIVFYQNGVSETVSLITTLPLKYHLGVWYMAIISGNLAYYLYVQAQRSIEVSEAVLFNYLQPIFTVPLAVLWLGEKITTNFVFGAILIAIGLFVAEKKKKSKG